MAKCTYVQKVPFMAKGIGPLIFNTRHSRNHREMTVHRQGQITWSIKSVNHQAGEG
jgi:hypothetical protein